MTYAVPGVEIPIQDHAALVVEEEIHHPQLHHQPKVLDSFVIQRDPRAETAVTVVLEENHQNVFAFSSLLASGLAVIASFQTSLS